MSSDAMVEGAKELPTQKLAYWSVKRRRQGKNRPPSDKFSAWAGPSPCANSVEKKNMCSRYTRQEPWAGRDFSVNIFLWVTDP